MRTTHFGRAVAKRETAACLSPSALSTTACSIVVHAREPYKHEERIDKGTELLNKEDELFYPSQ